MCVAVNSKMQLSPDTTALFAVLSDFPFCLHQRPFSPVESITVCDFTPGGRFETDIRLCPLTDTGCNPGSATERSSGQNGINKTLRSLQGQLEYAFNHPERW